MKNLEDISLVTQAAVFHNRRAFDKLVVKYQSPVRRFFLSQTLGDEQLSDDLAQDTFIKAYVNLSKFRGAASFSTWLYRIAYNVFYDYTRSNKPTGDLEAPAVARKNSETGDSNLRMDLQQALSILGGNERTCIVLQLMEGQPIERIAAITGLAEGTVKSHLSRGKQKLATYLRQNGYDGK
ncbi:RNA polymerase sigma factor [Prevotella sp. KH2C16]|uniref:RNA polymerase sigma factor n=1 Tax=Prevotella sp. KH2C16 TaxID=1855325 RepID=UPI0008E464C3|nr:RNA polymerase sigma factor [Prevotella sp. KH2C16]SFG32696.1 RNA polymerase sigma-70 factor, ECF subfamily [Prevotella sp. KH2C16]